MHPINPLDTRDTRPKHREFDFVADQRSGPSWVAFLAVMLALALLIGVLIVLDGDNSSGSQEVPLPSEAPLVPGA